LSVELLGQHSSVKDISGGQKLKGRQRRIQPAGRVQTRPQAKADISGINILQPDARNLGQRIQALTFSRAHLVQPCPNQRPILSGKRGDVRHSSQSHQVQPIARVHTSLRVGS